MNKMSLVMATYGRHKEVGEFLKSIRNIDYDLNKIEIIIVDQNDEIRLDEIIENYEDLNILHIKSKIKGLSQNRNIGIKKCTGDIICFPDDDCEYLQDTLKQVDNIFNTTKADVVLGMIQERDGSDSLRSWSKDIEEINKGNFYRKCSSITMFYRKNDGIFFNEKLGAGNYFGSCEDADLLYRSIVSGSKVIYNPIVKLYHPHYASGHNMSINKIMNYGLGFGAFCRYNLDFNISMLLFKAEVYHLLKMCIGVVTFNKEKIKNSSVAFKSRIRGFKEAKIKK